MQHIKNTLVADYQLYYTIQTFIFELHVLAWAEKKSYLCSAKTKQIVH